MDYYFSENSLPCHCMVLDVRPPLYKTTGVGFGKIVDLSVRDDFPLRKGKIVLRINKFSQSEITAVALRQAPRRCLEAPPSRWGQQPCGKNLPGEILLEFSTIGIYTLVETIQRVAVQSELFCHHTVEDLR